MTDDLTPVERLLGEALNYGALMTQDEDKSAREAVRLLLAVAREADDDSAWSKTVLEPLHAFARSLGGDPR